MLHCWSLYVIIKILFHFIFAKKQPPIENPKKKQKVILTHQHIFFQ